MALRCRSLCVCVLGCTACRVQIQVCVVPASRQASCNFKPQPGCRAGATCRTADATYESEGFVFRSWTNFISVWRAKWYVQFQLRYRASRRGAQEKDISVECQRQLSNRVRRFLPLYGGLSKRDFDTDTGTWTLVQKAPHPEEAAVQFRRSGHLRGTTRIPYFPCPLRTPKRKSKGESTYAGLGLIPGLY